MLDLVYLWTYKNAFDTKDHGICYINLITVSFEVYQITGLNPTFPNLNKLFPEIVMTLLK